MKTGDRVVDNYLRCHVFKALCFSCQEWRSTLKAYPLPAVCMEVFGPYLRLKGIFQNPVVHLFLWIEGKPVTDNPEISGGEVGNVH